MSGRLPRSLLALAFFVSLAPMVAGPVAALTSCAAPGVFSPAGAAGVEAAFAALCPLEALASPGLAGACPGEDAAFNAVVSADTAPAPVAKASPVPLLRRGLPPEPPLVHIGSVPPGPGVVGLQRRALALPPGKVLVLATADAGAPVVDAGDAGR